MYIFIYIKACIIYIQKGGLDPDLADKEGRTPLHKAALTGCSQTCEALLEAGADPSLSDHHGFTPLQIACCKGHTEVTKLLVETQADKEAYLSSPGSGMVWKETLFLKCV